ncbi:hypothetical protein RhiirA4_479448 [Rhizophagus irregularis]|uniref:Uncharacterized protein n=1 Tax=Rhizophagus irregularis TaxID=588596 RepID=A0A2I1HGF5_9GLOM|nr:hypothetical protein RhiirA4_479448 [Rhizophagus irregularis]
MSITEKQNNNLNYIRWIKKAIENNFIIYYDHTEFKNKKEVDNSNNSVGKIFETNWNNTNLVVKTSYELDIRKIVNEVFNILYNVITHISIFLIFLRLSKCIKAQIAERSRFSFKYFTNLWSFKIG